MSGDLDPLPVTKAIAGFALVMRCDLQILASSMLCDLAIDNLQVHGSGRNSLLPEKTVSTPLLFVRAQVESNEVLVRYLDGISTKFFQQDAPPRPPRTLPEDLDGEVSSTWSSAAQVGLFTEFQWPVRHKDCSGSNSWLLFLKWIQETGAIGLSLIYVCNIVFDAKRCNQSLVCSSYKIAESSWLENIFKSLSVWIRYMHTH